MFKIILLKEMRETIGSAKFVFSFSVCTVLILLAFYVGARNYQVNRAQYEASVRENLRQMEGLTDWGQVESQIFLPPTPLAALISGLSNDVGRSIKVEAVGELISENSRYGEDPIYAVFRFLDLEFVFQVVLSLFAILLAYNAVNGEKEQGTLKLTFANAVPKDRYILAKLSGVFASVVVPMLLPILIGCGILVIMDIPMNGSEWLRLAMIVVAGLLFFMVFLNLSIFVSAKTERSSYSFLILLIAWIFFVLIVPRTSILLAGRAIDVPSIDEIHAQKFRNQSQLWTEDMQKIDAFVPPSNDPEKAFAAFNTFMNTTRETRETKIAEFNQRLNEDRNNRQAVQREWAFGIARFSPATSLSLAVMSLAGTSHAIAQQFLDQARSYQQSFAQFIKSKNNGETGGHMVRVKIGGAPQEKAKPINPYEIPAFHFQSMSVGEYITPALTDIGLLIGFNLMFFAGAVWAFSKFDVR
ncbi:ABC transporter permease subunit [bacterium]|nr:ABC transporter permease subunit [bacterium]